MMLFIPSVTELYEWMDEIMRDEKLQEAIEDLIREIKKYDENKRNFVALHVVGKIVPEIFHRIEDGIVALELTKISLVMFECLKMIPLTKLLIALKEQEIGEAEHT